MTPLRLPSPPFQTQLSNIRAVLWLTPLFPVDYTRSIARETHAHQSVVIQVATAGLILRTVENGKGNRRKDTRGRLGHDEPLESVGRVNLQERIVRWTGQAIVWLMRKVVAM